MPQTSLEGPEGLIRVNQIGIHPVYDSDVAQARLKIENNATFIGEFDPNKCSPALGEQGLSVRMQVLVNNVKVKDTVLCVPQFANDPDGKHIDVTFPFDVDTGEYTVAFHFSYAKGDKAEIGSESYQVRRVDSLSNAEWEPISPEEHHETGDIVEVETTLDAPDIPFQDLVMNLGFDLWRLGFHINQELPGQEEVTVMNSSISDNGDGTYDYRIVYHVDHASPIAASTLIGVIVGGVALAIFGASMAFTSLQVRKMTENPAGAAVAGIGSTALLVGAGFLALREWNKRE